MKTSIKLLALLIIGLTLGAQNINADRYWGPPYGYPAYPAPAPVYPAYGYPYGYPAYGYVDPTAAIVGGTIAGVGNVIGGAIAASGNKD